MAPVATHLELIGNQFKVIYDDGSTAMAVPTMGSIWLVGATGSTPPVDPPPGTGDFMWPFDPSVYTSSEYGPRSGGAGSFHEGIDLAPSGGTPIPASGAGVVEEQYYHGAFGNLMILFHGTHGGYDLRTLYAHREYLTSHSIGQAVTKGEIIGTVGETGGAYGAHLHFETHQSAIGAGITWNLANDGGYRTAINPRDFMVTYGG